MLNSHNANLLWKIGPAARALGVSVEELEEMVESGSVPVVDLPGGHVRFSPAALRAWVQRRARPAESMGPFGLPSFPLP